jgi:hypothetical protein
MLCDVTIMGRWWANLRSGDGSVIADVLLVDAFASLGKRHDDLDSNVSTTRGSYDEQRLRMLRYAQ